MNLKKITEYLTDTLKADPRNIVRKGLYFYGPPLAGAATADDPIFNEFRKPEIIGRGFRTPRDWLGSARTVISYFLPFTADMHELNERPGVPAREWLLERGRGGLLNRELRDGLVKKLRLAGYDATAPSSSPEFAVDGYSSNWPERHIGYAVGLGTFGLNGSLLTEAGCAGRWGSVVTSLEFKPTPRLYDGPYDYCVYYRDGTCAECGSRCPADALELGERDLKACEKYCKYVASEIYDTSYEHCGKCQSAVRCAKSIP